MKKGMFVCAALSAMVVAGCGTAQQAQTSASSAPTSFQTTESATTTALKSQSVSLTVLPGGRLGPDGKLHDTFTNPNFSVVEGVPVTLSVYNYDGGTHSITSTALGLNLQAKGSAKKGIPTVTSVTFTPSKTGDFNWQCMDVCDGQNKGWAMSHNGYMEGTIHIVPYVHKQYIYLAVKDGLHYASADNKLHDSFSPASFTAQRGIPVQVTVENFDTGKHSITAPGLNLNQIMAGAKKAGQPTITTFTFTPTKDGTFNWMCTIPCDGNGWAMGHSGYMAGDITVTS